jgi:hypothetical protein
MIVYIQRDGALQACHIIYHTALETSVLTRIGNIAYQTKQKGRIDYLDGGIGICSSIITDQ